MRVRVLEARAVAYERSGDVEKAIADCRELISIHSFSHKGYLRLGKLYRLQGRKEDALRIYQIGQKRANHAEFEKQIEATLQPAANKLQAKLRQTSCTDPFICLPLEIIDRILGHLSLVDRHEWFKVSRAGLNSKANHPTMASSVLFASCKTPNAAMKQVSTSCRVKRLHLYSKQSFVEFIKLRKGKGGAATFQTLKALYLNGQNLSSITSDFVSLLPKHLKLLSLKNCALDLPTLINLLISNKSIEKIKIIGQIINSDDLVEYDLGLLESVLKLNPLKDISMGISGSIKLIPDIINLLPQKRSVAITCSPSQWSSCTDNLRCFEDSQMGWLKNAFFAAGQAATPPLQSHIRHLYIQHSDHLIFYQFCDLISLHITEETHLETLLTFIKTSPNLTELGLHRRVMLPRSMDPLSIITSIINGTSIRFLYLACLADLPVERRRQVISLFPKCQIIFDPTLAARVAQRRWRIPKAALNI